MLSLLDKDETTRCSGFLPPCTQGAITTEHRLTEQDVVTQSCFIPNRNGRPILYAHFFTIKNIFEAFRNVLDKCWDHLWLGDFTTFCQVSGNHSTVGSEPWQYPFARKFASTVSKADVRAGTENIMKMLSMFIYGTEKFKVLTTNIHLSIEKLPFKLRQNMACILRLGTISTFVYPSNSTKGAFVASETNTAYNMQVAALALAAHLAPFHDLAKEGFIKDHKIGVDGIITTKTYCFYLRVMGIDGDSVGHQSIAAVSR